MKRRIPRLAWLIPALVLMTSVRPAAAQTITTGTITGVVVDQQGGLLPGATATAVHVETGTTYSAVTQLDGRFSILNVRIGTYKVKVGLSGFKEQEQSDVAVALGEERILNYKLELATLATAITVVGVAAPIETTRPGAGATIGESVKDSMPTISRSLTDITRTNMYFNPNGFNEDTPSSAVAGRSQRYNSIQIDGAVNNDLFGLASAAGVPGGNAGTQPISLDAIQEIQLVVSPYDIRQSGFSGGGINAVTKSGTNSLRGTAYYYGRSESLVGKGITNTPISAFGDKQMGFSLGGPIRQNKAFYFGTYEAGRRLTPTGFSVGGSGVDFGNEALVDRYLDILRNQYGYDIGAPAKDEFSRDTVNDKFFVRADFNLKDRHQLTIRHNFVDASNDVGTPSATGYRTPDNFYDFRSQTNATVGQLTSRFGTSVNEARIAYTRIRDRRGGQEFETRRFPTVEVVLSGSLTITSGRETFSTANELDQNILEITDDLTMVRGNHTFTVGTHNEFFGFRNLFIRDNFGRYRFNSLDLFEQGLAQQYDYSFSATSDPKQPAKFDVNHMGFYAGDQWRARSNLTITSGMRVDIVRFPDKPTANPAAEANFGYATDVVPNTTLWSPRVGFNWSPRHEPTEQIRGGIGLFAGRPPYVWISNQYGNTGIDFTRVGASNRNDNRIPFITDPDNQAKTVTGAPAGSFTNEIDLIDPEFKYPSILRGNLSYDTKMPFGMYGTVELLWSSTVNDIRYENLNLQQIGTQPLDGRPRYALTVVPTLSNVLFLTNTDQGDQWSLGFDVKRPFSNGLYFSGSYIYGQSKTVADGTRDQAISVWGGIYVPGDPNAPILATSDYDPGHRITFTTSYDIQLGKGYTLTASAYYSGQSGRPYSLSWGSSGASVNGDAQGFNDLLYLPTSTDTLTYTNGTYQQLADFFALEECYREAIGTIIGRNTCRAPWNNTLDARLNVGLPFRRIKAEVTLDILNLINLFDRTKGIYEYAGFNQITAFTPILTSGVVTGMNLANLTSPTFSRFTRSDLRSRWQMQIGARVRF
jgi:hypothetical protein